MISRKVPDQLLVCGVENLKVLNDTKFRGLLFAKPVTGWELSLEACYYFEAALAAFMTWFYSVRHFLMREKNIL